MVEAVLANLRNIDARDDSEEERGIDAKRRRIAREESTSVDEGKESTTVNVGEENGVSVDVEEKASTSVNVVDDKSPPDQVSEPST